MVMGDNSCSKGCGFESRHCILDGRFFTMICCKNCNVSLKRLKRNEKEAGVDPFFNKKEATALPTEPFEPSTINGFILDLTKNMMKTTMMGMMAVINYDGCFIIVTSSPHPLG